MDHVPELRDAIDQTARVCRSNLVFLLIVGTFLAILTANTDDMLLLKSGTIGLPLMDVGIPVVVFYAVSPGLYLLLNMNLFFRLVRLTRIVRILRDQFHILPNHRISHYATIAFHLIFYSLYFRKKTPLHQKLFPS